MSRGQVKPRSRLGGRPPCPVEPAHGHMYLWDGGRWFCSHSDHDRDLSPRFFTDEDITLAEGATPA